MFGQGSIDLTKVDANSRTAAGPTRGLRLGVNCSNARQGMISNSTGKKKLFLDSTMAYLDVLRKGILTLYGMANLLQLVFGRWHELDQGEMRDAV